MNRTVVWIVGEPGAGKTTLARALLGPSPYTLNPWPKWTISGPLSAVGHYRGDVFDGGDTVPPGAIYPALDFAYTHLADSSTIILDGLKFASKRAVETVRGWVDPPQVRCLLLECLPWSAEKRRLLRGPPQSAAWIQGVRTRARNFFAENFSLEEKIRLKSDGHPEDIVEIVRPYLGIH